jgi:hypothetical protein
MAEWCFRFDALTNVVGALLLPPPQPRWRRVSSHRHRDRRGDVHDYPSRLCAAEEAWRSTRKDADNVASAVWEILNGYRTIKIEAGERKLLDVLWRIFKSVRSGA